MELLTKDLLLRTLTSDDLDETARMWNYPDGVTPKEAAEILKGIQDNLKKNKPGAIYHLCLGVFEKSDPKHIVGWCGLDGTAAPDKLEEIMDLNRSVLKLFDDMNNPVPTWYQLDNKENRNDNT